MHHAFTASAEDGGVCELHVVYTHFTSMVSQETRVIRLLPLEIVEAEVIAALSLEKDRNRGEELEDVEQLLIRRVVGKEVAEIHLVQGGDGARERCSPAAADADAEAKRDKQPEA